MKNLFVNNQTVIIQEFFEGTGIGVEVLASEGEILTAFQHIRMHEKRIWGLRNIGGASTYRKSHPIDPFLMTQAKKIIQGLNYTGVAMLEFRKNYETKESVLIEINGRFWGSLPLAVASGADFPYYLYMLLTEKKKTFSKIYNNNLFCRGTTEDLYWIYDEFTSFKSLKIREKFIGKILLEFSNILLFRERNDTLVLDDPRPGIMEICALVHLPVSILQRKLRFQLRNSKISRKIRSQQFKRAILSAKNILFVCKGNICRSPFAEHYFRTFLPEEIHTLSCGYIEQNGRESPPEALRTAKKFGVDLSNHRAHQITEEMVRKADLIIIFDETNFRILVKRYRKYKNKIWFLAEICPDIPIYIEDPFRKDNETFAKVYSTITYCIDSINQDLKGKLRK